MQRLDPAGKGSHAHEHSEDAIEDVLASTGLCSQRAMSTGSNVIWSATPRRANAPSENEIERRAHQHLQQDFIWMQVSSESLQFPKALPNSNVILCHYGSFGISTFCAVYETRRLKPTTMTKRLVPSIRSTSVCCKLGFCAKPLPLLSLAR